MSFATAINFATETNPLTGMDNHAVTLTPPTILDASMCREFWEATQQVRDSKMKMVIDLRKTDSIHASGYTLLWMLKDSLAKKRADLLLIHCQPRLKKALQLRGFEAHFMLL